MLSSPDVAASATWDDDIACVGVVVVVYNIIILINIFLALHINIIYTENYNYLPTINNNNKRKISTASFSLTRRKTITAAVSARRGTWVRNIMERTTP